MSVPRFFVDENDLGLARLLAQRRDDVVYPGCSSLPDVPLGTPDDEWLQIVGARSLVVITRDKRIRRRPVERQRWLEHRVRGVCITAGGQLSSAATLALVTGHWHAIEAAIAERGLGPWMVALTRHGLRDLDMG